MDDKKKLIVVCVLVLVIACVGAFQFLGKPSAPAPAAVAPKPGVANTAPGAVPGATAGGPAAEVAPPVIKNPQVANELPSRDPFFVPMDVRPQLNNRGTAVKGTRAASMSGHYHPGGMGGSFKPLPIGEGTLSKIASLPSSSEKAPDDKPFGYKVVGTIGGVKPEVLIEDSAGNQKLVPVGSAIDGDSRVRGVEDGAVTIEYKGKKIRLTVGGNNPGGK